MTTTGFLTVVGFWAMQVLSQLFFQWGSAGGSRWLWGFLGGNLFGLFSVFLLMCAYKSMNPNFAFGVCTGGAFVAGQLALALICRSGVSNLQWVGVGIIATGMILFAAAKPGTITP